MSNLGYLIAKKEELEAKALKLSNEIETMEETVKEAVVKLSKDGGSFGGVTVSGGGGKPSLDKNGIIDYSVTMDDLELVEERKVTYTSKGKERTVTYNVYTSKKTDALYVITDENLKNKSVISPKNVIIADLVNSNRFANNQFAIVTYGDCYQYDISNKKNCTKDYAVVGKTGNGKMYCLATNSASEVKVDDGGKDDAPLTIVNGMIVANKMRWTMEEGALMNFYFKIKDNILGGQKVYAYNRLEVGGGHIFMPYEWQMYNYSKDGDYQLTEEQIMTRKNNKIIDNKGEDGYGKILGIKGLDIPQELLDDKINKDIKKEIIGYVDGTMIPVTIESYYNGKDEFQSSQATFCYYHTGGQKDQYAKSVAGLQQQVVVGDWSSNINCIE